jgi:hypothetical protein
MSLTPPHAGAPEAYLAAVAVEGRLHVDVCLHVVRRLHTGAPEGCLHTGVFMSLTSPHTRALEGHLTAIDEEEHTVKVAQEEATEVAGEGGLGGGDQGCGAV